jgi:hypothetical protein
MGMELCQNTGELTVDWEVETVFTGSSVAALVGQPW